MAVTKDGMKDFVVTRRFLIKQINTTLQEGDVIQCDGRTTMQWQGGKVHIASLGALVDQGWIIEKAQFGEVITERPVPRVDHNLNIRLKENEYNDVESRRKVKGMKIDKESFVKEQPDDLIIEYILGEHWKKRGELIANITRPEVLQRLQKLLPKTNQQQILDQIKKLEEDPSIITESPQDSEFNNEIKMDFATKAKKYVADYKNIGGLG